MNKVYVNKLVIFIIKCDAAISNHVVSLHAQACKESRGTWESVIAQ